MKFLPNDDSDEDDDASSVIDISDFLTDTVVEAVTKEPTAKATTDCPLASNKPDTNETVTQSQKNEVKERSATIRIVMGDSVRRWRNQSALTGDGNGDTVVWRQTGASRIDWSQAQLQVIENRPSLHAADGSVYVSKENIEQSENSAYLDTIAIWDETQQVYRLEIPHLMVSDLIPSQLQSDQLGSAKAMIDPWTQAKRAEEVLKKRKLGTTVVKRPAKRAIGGPTKAIK